MTAPDLVLALDSPGSILDLTRADLEALSEAREGVYAAVSFRALAGRLPERHEATHATFHAADGYAASVPLEQALADARLLVPPAGSGKVGVRLIVTEGGTTCLNVKAVQRIELTAGPGRHTVDPNPHTPARVPGWDDE